MNASAEHPTDQTLRAYGLGRLDDGSAGSVHAHLEGCPDCRRRVAEVTADSFVGRLRDAGAGRESFRPVVSSTDGLSMLEATWPMPAPPPADTLPPGLVDHPDYEILRELGRGGMGVVYLAHNRLMGRMEVLKVVGGHLVSRPAILERFTREIRSAARLHHPNIVTAYTALRLGEGFVLSMEYVEGLDLARMVKAKGPLPVANACYYVQQAALGLQHAHEHGMVHRDIKPANLILARAGSRPIVKVLDFGLAKVTSEGKADSGLTREGQMLGTPDYIAPEQIRDAQSADIRADIYSLGCTLYYLLSGRPPFTGDHLWDVYQAHFSIEAAPLNLARPEVPVELAALVAKMMAKDPARRFQEPKEIARALEPFFKKGAAAPPPEVSRAPTTPRVADPTGPPSVPAAPSPSSTKAGAIPEGLIDISEAEPLRDTYLDVPQPAPRPSPGPVLSGLEIPGMRGWWAAAGVLLLGLIVVGAAMVVRIRTSEGVIVLENLPEEAEVYVDGSKVKVHWPGGGVPAEIVVPPGEHGVQVKAGGFTAFGERVTVDAGGRRGIRVRLEPLAKIPPPAPSDRDSAATDRIALGRPSHAPAAREHFTRFAGLWEVDGNELVSSDDGERHAMGDWRCALAFGDERWTDYDFTVDAMRTSGDDGFSLLFREREECSGAFQYSVVNGQAGFFTPTLAKNFAIILRSHKWYTARVHVRGRRFVCSLYDCEIGAEIGRVDGEEDAPPMGRVGLSGESFRFRNIKVTSPDGVVLWEGPPSIGATTPANPPSRPGPGFVSLFNGRDLAGWTAFLNGRKVPTSTVARVSGGEIILVPGANGGGLRTDKTYRDFTLRFEYFFPIGSILTVAGSGVIILPEKSGGLSNRQGIQGQVMPGESGDFWAFPRTSLVGKTGLVARKLDAERPRGEWNAVVLRCEGSLITYELNGREVNGAESQLPISGWIGLMNQGSDVRFRNISIAERPGPARER